MFLNFVIYNFSTNNRNILNSTIYDMRKDSHSHKLIRLARRNVVLRACDLKEAGIARTYLTRLTAAGKLERFGRGLYRVPNAASSEHESMAAIAVKVPQAVFCLATALQFHELTTQLPRQLWIAMPRGSHAPRIDYPPIKMIQFSGESFTQGIEVHERDRVKIRVYSLEKTLVDCFKHRNKVGLDVALEALKQAKATRKIKADQLWQYAKAGRVANIMRPYLEALE